MGNKIADKITPVGKTESNEKEDEMNKRQEVCIKPINYNDLTLF